MKLFKKNIRVCNLMKFSVSVLFIMIMLFPLAAAAEQSEEELAKATLNPIASLVSLPIQNNWDYGIGAADATRYTMNVTAGHPVFAWQLV